MLRNWPPNKSKKVYRKLRQKKAKKDFAIFKVIKIVNFCVLLHTKLMNKTYFKYCRIIKSIINCIRKKKLIYTPKFKHSKPIWDSNHINYREKVDGMMCLCFVLQIPNLTMIFMNYNFIIVFIF